MRIAALTAIGAAAFLPPGCAVTLGYCLGLIFRTAIFPMQPLTKGQLATSPRRNADFS